MKGIKKAFHHHLVLDGVDFEVCAGEVHALMGENGAGKSTLMKILTGMYEKDAGTITVDGKEVHYRHPKEAERDGIVFIHQELNIIPTLTVAENMFLGREQTIGKTGWIRQKEMAEEAKRYLQKLGMDIDPNEMAGCLSVGKQQVIEIARALSTNAKCLIMDEPTAALTDREIQTLFTVIRTLKQQGVAIVYISHRMEEIFTICDRISVLRDGQFIGTKLIRETTFDEIVHMMVGRQIGERFPKRSVQIGEERLRVEGLTQNGVFHNVSFTVRAGEILGVAGLMGAGRTEIMEAIFGIRKIDAGTVYLNQQPVKITSPRQAVEYGMAFITEDRKGKGLVLQMSVRENLTLPKAGQLAIIGFIDNKKENELVRSLIERLHIKAASAEMEVKSLSGGNQQKVVFGKWLAMNPSILILDEPTRGVDVGAKKEIYEMMNELAAQGVAIIMVSSELPEILGMSDRIMVVHEGKVTAILQNDNVDQETIMRAATGGDV
ncbi:sugar ABC transporter ATP-binding protein [Anoxybacillus sp. LAT_35]|uniref:sugar ABC transporter ATP-binding protein n=1 Tax=unclassified Anoxybacillus TaxID=2639704 RepID=UPI001EEC5265|nr:MULTISPECIES: sugar ABC transporter ATP-binding protein [unclassified Anoxybacillus]MCG6172625.1 sugar ABC transporter ATP-binding protein [Anoxybacillus sp. LAT_11]MCG6178932.1 sugar ABC transporter ATP-binding protein [Anoxybacillus sp. LAT_35]MCG6182775.1 sugar ABC transporter ATP-binding protein [Anoxybacillus sp. LAT_26]MCG6196681.1 sugar ABC transporter ATP-binding protein [Anoxybacillus sp. LAT_38]